MEFSHERQDVYRTALEYAALAWRLGADLPVSHSRCSQRLIDASQDVALSIARADGCEDDVERQKTLGGAVRAARQCAAAQDLLQACGALSAAQNNLGKDLIGRVIVLLDASRSCGHTCRSASENTEPQDRMACSTFLDIEEVEYYR